MLCSQLDPLWVAVQGGFEPLQMVSVQCKILIGVFAGLMMCFGSVPFWVCTQAASFGGNVA